MTLVDAGVFLSGPHDEPVWLPAFYVDIYPTSNADYSRFVAATRHAPSHEVMYLASTVRSLEAVGARRDTAVSA